MNPSFGTGLSHTRHCSEGRASVSVHVLQDTWEHGFMTGERVSAESTARGDRVHTVLHRAV
jgi:hypothetical protein